MASSVKPDNIDSCCSGFEMPYKTDKCHNMYSPQILPLNSNSDWGSVTDHPLTVKARSHLSICSAFIDAKRLTLPHWTQQFSLALLWVKQSCFVEHYRDTLFHLLWILSWPHLCTVASYLSWGLLKSNSTNLGFYISVWRGKKLLSILFPAPLSCREWAHVVVHLSCRCWCIVDCIVDVFYSCTALCSLW